MTDMNRPIYIDIHRPISMDRNQEIIIDKILKLIDKREFNKIKLIFFFCNFLLFNPK